MVISNGTNGRSNSKRASVIWLYVLLCLLYCGVHIRITEGVICELSSSGISGSCDGSKQWILIGITLVTVVTFSIRAEVMLKWWRLVYLYRYGRKFDATLGFPGEGPTCTLSSVKKAERLSQVQHNDVYSRVSEDDIHRQRDMFEKKLRQVLQQQATHRQRMSLFMQLRYATIALNSQNLSPSLDLFPLPPSL